MLDQYWIMKYCILFHVPLWIVKGASDSFVPPPLPNGRLCYCPGVMEQFMCNVSGGVITQWTGTAFNCPPIKTTTLVHSQYSSGTAADGCGDLTAEGTAVDTSVDPDCYTSVLTVPITSNLHGLTVNCSRDGADDIIGSHTLRIATPLPPPNNLMVTNVGQSTFTVTWIEPISDCGTFFDYDVSLDCGETCSVTTSTSAVCSGWTVGQNCSVRVRASLCPEQPGSFSTPVTLTLQEPSPPLGNIHLEAMYCENSLTNLIINFPIVNPVTVAPGLTPPVMYSVQSGSTSETVPESSCNQARCEHQLSFSTNGISLTLTVSNGIGDGRSVTLPSVPVDPTSLVTVTAVVIGTNVVIFAQLTNIFQSSTNLVVIYGIKNDSSTTTVTSTTSGGAGDTLSVTLTSLQSEVTYEYAAVVTSSILTLRIKDIFDIECRDEKLGTISTSGTPPMCQMDGFKGGVYIANGFVCYTGRGLGSGRATAHCDQGYRLSSSESEMRQCQPDGTWSEIAAVCMLQGAVFTGTSIALSVVLTFVLTLVVGVSIGVLSVLVVNKCRRSERVTLQTETEMIPPPAIYEEPDGIKPDPQTQGNVAYGHVQYRQ